MSEDWINLILQMKKLDEISFSYNQIDKNIRQNDLKKALNQNNMMEELLVLRMMANGLLFGDSIELVLEDIVYIVVYGNEECVGYAMEALRHVDLKKNRYHIIKYIYKYTERYKDDEFTFRYAWRLLYNLGLKRELVEYINKYEKFLYNELSQEDIEDIDKLNDFI